MERQRLRDGLVGAAVAVGVLTLVLVVALWSLSRPAGQDAGTGPPAPAPATGGRAAGGPPSDLADDQTWLGDVALDAGTLASAGSVLRDVDAVGDDVRTGPDGVTAGALTVDATVPFDVVAARLGQGTTVRAAGGGRARVERSLEVAGRRVDVVATGTVEAVGGRLVVEPRSVDVGGPDVLADALGAVARRLVTIEQDVEDLLPDGLVLRDVTVRDDGFRVRLAGTDVRLAP